MTVASGLQDTCDCQTLLIQHNDLKKENQILKQSCHSQIDDLDQKIEDMQGHIDRLNQMLENHAETVEKKIDQVAEDVALLNEGR